MAMNLLLVGFSMGGVGVLMMVGGVWRANSLLRGHDDPLAELHLSNVTRVEIRKQLRVGELPTETKLREAVIRWAQREATVGSSAFRWKWVYWLGLVFSFGTLYAIPGALGFVVAIQLILALFLGISMSLSWKVLLACRNLTTSIRNKAIDPDRPVSSSSTGFGFTMKSGGSESRGN